MFKLSKGDYDAFFGVLFDGMPKIITGVIVLTPILGPGIVFKELLPSIGLAIFLAGLFFYYWGERAKRKTGNMSMVALPGGVNAGRFFVWLFAIMIPVYEVTSDPVLALYVGLGANILSSVISIGLAYVGETLSKLIPSEALFGALSGGALAWLTLATFNDMFGSLEMTIISMISIFIVLASYLGKVDLKFSPALVTVVVGILMGFVLGVTTLGAINESVSNFGLYIPGSIIVSGGYVSNLIAGIVEAIKYLPIILVFSFGETISNMQGIEQAKNEGDIYDVKSTLVGVNIVSLVSGFLGNPFPIGVWWGYPSWKEVKAGTSYQLLHGVAYLLLAITGVIAIVTTLIPVGAVLPILVFIGLASLQSAFSSYDKKYYGIMALALAIPIGELAGSPDFISQGAMLIALLWGTILIFMAQNKWNYVAYSFFGSAAFALLGLIHTPNFILGFNISETGTFEGVAFNFDVWALALAYLILGVFCYLLGKSNKVKYTD